MNKLEFRYFLEEMEKKDKPVFMQPLGAHADELNIDSDVLNKAIENDPQVSGGLGDFLGKDWKTVPWKWNPETGKLEIMNLGKGAKLQASRDNKRLRGEKGGERAHIKSKEAQRLWGRGWEPAVAAAQQQQQPGGMSL